MPLYLYKCVLCGHKFEKIKKYTIVKIEPCPKCNGISEQQVTAHAHHEFKGAMA